MPKVDENKIYSELMRYRLDGRVASEHASVQLRLRPVDNHAGDSPDFLLWVRQRERFAAEFTICQVRIRRLQ
jgi:hypothetical protein